MDKGFEDKLGNGDLNALFNSATDSEILNGVAELLSTNGVTSLNQLTDITRKELNSLRITKIQLNAIEEVLNFNGVKLSEDNIRVAQGMNSLAAYIRLRLAAEGITNIKDLSIQYSEKEKRMLVIHSKDGCEIKFRGPTLGVISNFLIRMEEIQDELNSQYGEES